MKHRAFHIAVAFLLLLVLVGCAEPQSESPALTATELLDLGEKYLLELNYEQALVQFLKVIEIEPMNPRGYTGVAEAYVGLGEIEKAVEVLEQGLEVLPDDETVREMLDATVSRIGSSATVQQDGENGDGDKHHAKRVH